MKPEQILNNITADFMDELKIKLKDIKEGSKEEIYFHDIMHEAVDKNCPATNKEALAVSEEYDHTKDIDEGIIDKSSLNRTLVTTAYACLEQEMFEDDMIQKLQDKLNNEEISYQDAQELLKQIEFIDRKKITKVYVQGKGFVDARSNANNIFIKKKFAVAMEDFPAPYFNHKQMIDLADGSIKILTSNKRINQNALVIEHADRIGECRIYLMDKDADLDIRDLFKQIPSSIKANHYSLRVQDYTDGVVMDSFGTKEKEKFIKVIHYIVNRLTDKVINDGNATLDKV